MADLALPFKQEVECPFCHGKVKIEGAMSMAVGWLVRHIRRLGCYDCRKKTGA